MVFKNKNIKNIFKRKTKLKNITLKNKFTKHSNFIKKFIYTKLSIIKFFKLKINSTSFCNSKNLPIFLHKNYLKLYSCKYNFKKGNFNKKIKILFLFQIYKSFKKNSKPNFLNHILFYKKWNKSWKFYRKVLLRTKFFKRKLTIILGKYFSKWFLKFYKLKKLTHKTFKTNNKCSNQKPQQLNINTVLKYINTVWKSSFRSKLERFFFKRISHKVYVWIHNIWQTIVKKLHKWKKFESICLWRLTNKRFKFFLRLNLARIFLRTLGLFFMVVGGENCFAHVFAYLIKKFRKHWQLFRFIKSYMQLSQYCFSKSTVGGFRIVISGKLGGKLRAKKFIIGSGVIKFFMLSWKVNYTKIDSFTKFGIFGIQIWTQLKMVQPRTNKFKKFEMLENTEQSEAEKSIWYEKQMLIKKDENKNKKKRFFKKNSQDVIDFSKQVTKCN